MMACFILLPSCGGKSGNTTSGSALESSSIHPAKSESEFASSSPAASASLEPEKISVIEKLLPVETYSSERTEKITHIVIHFSSNVAKNPKNPYNIDDIWQIYYDYKVSPHYLIDRQGAIYRLIPENRAAWHAGDGVWNNNSRYTNKMNEYSIGIELMGIGTYDEMSLYLTKAEYNKLDKSLIGFTDAQYETLDNLLEDILVRNNGMIKDRNHILGHSDYTTRKRDPGILFDWTRIGLSS